VPLAGRPIAALVVLVLAAISDMLDGWLARRRQLTGELREGSLRPSAPHTGAREAHGAGRVAVGPEAPEGGARQLPTRPTWGEWLDPVCDKFFIIAVMAGLYLFRRPPLTTLLQILTREAAILALFLVQRLVPSLRNIRYDYRAHALGKAATAAQFLAATALLFAHPAAGYLAALCAVLGLLCAGVYAGRGARALLDKSRSSG